MATFAGQGNSFRKRKKLVKEFEKSNISSVCSLLDLLVNRSYIVSGDFIAFENHNYFHIS